MAEAKEAMAKSKKNPFPEFVAAELRYPYLEDSITYVFPRLREIDTKTDEAERIMGGGKKYPVNQRLSLLVENVIGLPDFEPRSPDETESAWRGRVFVYFSSKIGMELADDALIARWRATSPVPTFRSCEDRLLAEPLLGPEAS
jgi:hypothetical protein